MHEDGAQSMERPMSDTSCLDRGLTHLALVVREMDRSREFYEAFAGLRLVHERPAAGLINRVAWLADPHTAFTVVLIESKQLADTPLGPFGHLGMACASRAQVDRLADLARERGVLRSPPVQSPHPVGYWTYISDPDGNTLELSYGQQIRFTGLQSPPTNSQPT
jgi:catechol 2,3-dioxygenase-like lactoylglutathione lyase family enzyme